MASAWQNSMPLPTSWRSRVGTRRLASPSWKPWPRACRWWRSIREGPPICSTPASGPWRPPGDPVDFADKLARVLMDKSLAQQCRAYVAEYFSWDKTFRKLLTVYDH